MKLRNYLKDKEIHYTLKERVGKIATLDAHYKFIKLRDVKENKSQ